MASPPPPPQPPDPSIPIKPYHLVPRPRNQRSTSPHTLKPNGDIPDLSPPIGMNTSDQSTSAGRIPSPIQIPQEDNPSQLEELDVEIEQPDSNNEARFITPIIEEVNTNGTPAEDINMEGSESSFEITPQPRFATLPSDGNERSSPDAPHSATTFSREYTPPTNEQLNQYQDYSSPIFGLQIGSLSSEPMTPQSSDDSHLNYQYQNQPQSFTMHYEYENDYIPDDTMLQDKNEGQVQSEDKEKEAEEDILRLRGGGQEISFFREEYDQIFPTYSYSGTSHPRRRTSLESLPDDPPLILPNFAQKRAEFLAAQEAAARQRRSIDGSYHTAYEDTITNDTTSDKELRLRGGSGIAASAEAGPSSGTQITNGLDRQDEPWADAPRTYGADEKTYTFTGEHTVPTLPYEPKKPKPIPTGNDAVDAQANSKNSTNNTSNKTKSTSGAKWYTKTLNAIKNSGRKILDRLTNKKTPTQPAPPPSPPRHRRNGSEIDRSTIGTSSPTVQQPVPAPSTPEPQQQSITPTTTSPVSTQEQTIATPLGTIEGYDVRTLPENPSLPISSASSPVIPQKAGQTSQSAAMIDPGGSRYSQIPESNDNVEVVEGGLNAQIGGMSTPLAQAATFPDDQLSPGTPMTTQPYVQQPLTRTSEQISREQRVPPLTRARSDTDTTNTVINDPALEEVHQRLGRFGRLRQRLSFNRRATATAAINRPIPQPGSVSQDQPTPDLVFDSGSGTAHNRNINFLRRFRARPKDEAGSTSQGQFTSLGQATNEGGSTSQGESSSQGQPFRQEQSSSQPRSDSPTPSSTNMERSSGFGFSGWFRGRRAVEVACPCLPQKVEEAENRASGSGGNGGNGGNDNQERITSGTGDEETTDNQGKGKGKASEPQQEGHAGQGAGPSGTSGVEEITREGEVFESTVEEGGSRTGRVGPWTNIPDSVVSGSAGWTPRAGGNLGETQAGVGGIRTGFTDTSHAPSNPAQSLKPPPRSRPTSRSSSARPESTILPAELNIITHIEETLPDPPTIGSAEMVKSGSGTSGRTFGKGAQTPGTGPSEPPPPMPNAAARSDEGSIIHLEEEYDSQTEHLIQPVISTHPSHNASSTSLSINIRSPSRSSFRQHAPLEHAEDQVSDWNFGPSMNPSPRGPSLNPSPVPSRHSSGSEEESEEVKEARRKKKGKSKEIEGTEAEGSRYISLPIQRQFNVPPGFSGTAGHTASPPDPFSSQEQSPLSSGGSSPLPLTTTGILENPEYRLELQSMFDPPTLSRPSIDPTASLSDIMEGSQERMSTSDSHGSLSTTGHTSSSHGSLPTSPGAPMTSLGQAAVIAAGGSTNLTVGSQGDNENVIGYTVEDQETAFEQLESKPPTPDVRNPQTNNEEEFASQAADVHDQSTTETSQGSQPEVQQPLPSDPQSADAPSPELQGQAETSTARDPTSDIVPIEYQEAQTRTTSTGKEPESQPGPTSTNAPTDTTTSGSNIEENVAGPSSTPANPVNQPERAPPYTENTGNRPRRPTNNPITGSPGPPSYDGAHAPNPAAHPPNPANTDNNGPAPAPQVSSTRRRWRKFWGKVKKPFRHNPPNPPGA